MSNKGPKNDVPFPNYMAELLTDSEEEQANVLADMDKKVMEGFIQSILERLEIPHYHEGELVTQQYFKHLKAYSDELAEASGQEIDIELSIGGGVVRCMLANMYKYIYDQKNADIGEHQETAKGTAYQLQRAALADRESLISPLVLGVGSDLDIYYKVKTKGGNKPTSDQIKAGEQIKKDLEAHINKVETDAGLRQVKAKIKQSILPSADVKQIDNQINKASKQGGSTIDLLAFVLPNLGEWKSDEKNRLDLLEKRNYYLAQSSYFYGLIEKREKELHDKSLTVEDDFPIEKYRAKIGLLQKEIDNLNSNIKEQNYIQASKPQSKLKMPEGYEYILTDYLEGCYRYLKPISSEEKPGHKQAIRGLRPLLSMPFLQIKDETVILEELKDILNIIEKSGDIDLSALEQFDKMVRNANFELGHNRPHSAKEGTALHLSLKIADALFENKVGLNDKVRHLLPIFLQRLPASDPTKLKGVHKKALSVHFMDRTVFEKKHTDQGKLYHGTSADAGLCVLRGGFIMSTDRQGTAAMGPGVYTTKDAITVASYMKNSGLMLPIELSQKPLNILDWGELPHSLHEKLEQEAKASKTPKYDHVFEMLRDRTKYGVDIIIHEHVLIQNQNAIYLKQNLSDMLSWLFVPTQRDVNDEHISFEVKYTKLLGLLNYYLLFKDLGVDVSDTTKQLKSDNLMLKQINHDGDTFLNCAIRMLRFDLVGMCIETSEHDETLQVQMQNGMDRLYEELHSSLTSTKGRLKGGGGAHHLPNLIDEYFGYIKLCELLELNKMDVSKIKDLHDIDKEIDYVIMAAIKIGNVEALKQLFSMHQINPFKALAHTGLSPFDMAVKEGSEKDEILAICIKQANHHDLNQALFNAVRWNKSDTAEKLLEMGASIQFENVHGQTTLSEASKNKNPRIFQLCIELADSQDKDHALFKVSEASNWDGFKRLLDHGATFSCKSPVGYYDAGIVGLMNGLFKSNKERFKFYINKASDKQLNNALAYLVGSLPEHSSDLGEWYDWDDYDYDVLDNIEINKEIRKAELEYINLLLDNGASPSAIDTLSDENCFEMAISNNDDALFTLLVKHSNDESLHLARKAAEIEKRADLVLLVEKSVKSIKRGFNQKS